MFDRFTERARRVVALAREEAIALKHAYLGTEHLLLGLMREGGGVASQILRGKGVDPEQIRAKVAGSLSQGESLHPSGKIPFTPRAASCLEAAAREAEGLGQSYIGTEHILLGLLSDKDGVAFHALSDQGLEPDDLRREIGERMRPAPAADKPPPPAAAPVPTAESITSLFEAAGLPIPPRIAAYRDRCAKHEEAIRSIQALQSEKEKAVAEERYECAGQLKEALRAAREEKETLEAQVREVPTGLGWQELVLSQNRRILELLTQILEELKKR